MAGLVLKLRPHEELMINGVVLENGDRRALLRIKSDNAKILRMRGAVKAEDANTPAARACYIAQLAVGGLIAPPEATDMLSGAVEKLNGELTAEERADIEHHVAIGDFYRVMRALSTLIPRRAAADPAAEVRA